MHSDYTFRPFAFIIMTLLQRVAPEKRGSVVVARRREHVRAPNRTSGGWSLALPTT